MPLDHIYVYLGMHDTRRSTGQVRYGVEKLIVHPSKKSKRQKHRILFYIMMKLVIVQSL